MPLQYAGILEEYEYTRQRAALFDISHMGEFIVEGDALASGLDGLVTCSIKDLPVKSCRYGTLLNEQGGILDDLLVFRMEQEKWMIVVNGATTDKDAEHFSRHIGKAGRFTDISLRTGKLDIQGPGSRDVLSPLVNGIERLKYYTFDEFDVVGERVIVSRTGYTGELGYEIYYPWDKTEKLWNKILENKQVAPAGLGARDVLRMEMGYSLYGHELSEDISPLEAGLERFVDFDKDFIGKGCLIKQRERGMNRRLVCFVSENRRSPRNSNKILSPDLREIGVVTSGTFAPSLKRGIGMGFVSSALTPIGEKVIINDQRNNFKAEITGRPFYKNGSLKN